MGPGPLGKILMLTHVPSSHSGSLASNRDRHPYLTKLGGVTSVLSPVVQTVNALILQRKGGCQRQVELQLGQ